MICLLNKNTKNVKKVFSVFLLMLISPFSSFAVDFCDDIPKNVSMEKPLKYLSSRSEEILFYPKNISKQLSEKYKKAVQDYNDFVDKSSARNKSHSLYEFTADNISAPQLTAVKESFQETLSSGSNWLSTFYEKFLSPKTAEASDMKGIYSYPQLKSILNKKYSFQDNSLVEF